MMNLIRKHIGDVYRRSESWFNHRFEDGVVALRYLVNRQDMSKRLLILDDIFPQMLSSFRVAEYNTYLKVFQDVRVCSTATAFPLVCETRSFREVVKEYENRFPEMQGKVLEYTWRQDLRSGLIYTIFLNNAFRFIDVAERHRSLFVFTLYPGGGFDLRDHLANGKLRRVFSSPNFRRVIVTQKISFDYMVDQGLCPPEQIEFVYGGVLPSHLLVDKIHDKQYFRDNKGTFDICFVANKYMQQGIDKGYDIFIKVARLLSKSCKHVIFHVVGPFDSSDIDVSGIEERIRFYGMKYTDFFPDFYTKMDIILSPNRPFVLRPGAFDGFPTGACVEAGLCGVAVFCTDPLQQNIKFQDGNEIVVIQPKAEEIYDQIFSFYQRPEDLYKLSAEGQQAFRKVFDLATQMQPRIDILSQFLVRN